MRQAFLDGLGLDSGWPHYNPLFTVSIDYTGVPPFLEHQKAFESIKKYLVKPPILAPPRWNRQLKLYISTAENSTGALLAQDNDENKEQAIHYISRILAEVETRYSPVEKLSLYFSVMKLRHYMLPTTVNLTKLSTSVKLLLGGGVFQSYFLDLVANRLASAEIDLQIFQRINVKKLNALVGVT